MYKFSLGNSVCLVDRHPSTCPRCKAYIQAIPRYVATSDVYEKPLYQVSYQCPNATCERLFLAEFRREYERGTQYGRLVRVLPNETDTRVFHRIIERISPAFCSIYNEAFAAEQLGLTQICGVGYRKALEFLIKDYLVSLEPESDDAAAEHIRCKFLGACIDQDLKCDNIKIVAKRATWLGNDETHYVRKWVDKDLDDLKRLIDLTLAWIAHEEETKEALQSMPDGN